MITTPRTGEKNLAKHILLAALAITASLTLSVDNAEAFGGRGAARRYIRSSYYAPVTVVVPAAVPRVYSVPVVSYYSAPVYRPPAVSVRVGSFGNYYGTGYRGFGYPVYGRGVSIGIGF
jgi:hypothetical protein